ncbi:photosystem II assembly protein Psb35 [Capilliphycus salinus ALCB114379]|uniref:photosystem II assembly protein Psb35 n=1 Tax=Capilliphycus salinus TaxID=2768948 RepID=UPI0039A41DFE
MSLLLEVGVDAAPHFPISVVVVGVVGFLAATTIGSVAWYNSKRPPGWEDKERPDIVPNVEKSEDPGLG